MSCVYYPLKGLLTQVSWFFNNHIMNAKIIVLLCCLFWLGACSQNDMSLPTRVPTALPLPSLPPTNTPLSSEIQSEMPNAVNAIDATANDAAEIDAILQEIDQEVCREVFDTQAELEALQDEGKDVAELATAVAELAVELDYCKSLITPTPVN